MAYHFSLIPVKRSCSANPTILRAGYTSQRTACRMLLRVDIREVPTTAPSFLGTSERESVKLVFD